MLGEQSCCTQSLYLGEGTQALTDVDRSSQFSANAEAISAIQRSGR